MSDWQPYADYALEHHTVVGDLRMLRDVYSPQLGNTRDVFVYLPPSYATSERRYPVIYMHDGQNLFDDVTSYAGEWQVDETMERLSNEGREAIVVGVANAGVERLMEYGPFINRRGELGKGALYLAFLAETLKPRIDDTFRTLPNREHTATIGSSMGGLISLYALFARPETFGFAGVMSPSLWFGEGATFDVVRRAPFAGGKLYLDVGTREGPHAHSNRPLWRAVSRRYAQNVRQLRRTLLHKGYRLGYDLAYVEERGGVHSEANWARRLPVALRFFLPAHGDAPTEESLTRRARRPPLRR